MYTLNKPYTDKERADFIVEYNHRQGLIIEETDTGLIAKEYIPTQEELAQARITELKQLLSDTDYQAIKYAEGELTEEEYSPIREQRKEYRKEINELEKDDVD